MDLIEDVNNEKENLGIEHTEDWTKLVCTDSDNNIRSIKSHFDKILRVCKYQFDKFSYSVAFGSKYKAE